MVDAKENDIREASKEKKGLARYVLFPLTQIFLQLESILS